MGVIMTKRLHENMNTMQLKKAYIELQSKYNELLQFVKKIPDLHHYMNHNEVYELGWDVNELLKKIGEL